MSEQGEAFKARLRAIGEFGKVVLKNLEEEHPEIFTEKFDKPDNKIRDMDSVVIYREAQEGFPMKGLVRTRAITRAEVRRQVGVKDRMYANLRIRFERADRFNKEGHSGTMVILEHDIGDNRWYTNAVLDDYRWANLGRSDG